MPWYTVLTGERQRVHPHSNNGEDNDVRKFEEMLKQAGFETNVKFNVFKPVRLREGVKLKTWLLSGPYLLPRRHLEESEGKH